MLQPVTVPAAVWSASATMMAAATPLRRHLESRLAVAKAAAGLVVGLVAAWAAWAGTEAAWMGNLERPASRCT